MIVEDDPGLQKQLKWCFDSYEVLQAGTRAEAIALMRRFESPGGFEVPGECLVGAARK